MIWPCASRPKTLCAKLLRIVHSAFFSCGQVISDLRTATVRLGLDMLRVFLITERASSGLSPARIETVQ